jgi:hypothetical protein
MLLWRYFELTGVMYEVAPGMIAGFIPYLLKKIFSKSND